MPNLVFTQKGRRLTTSVVTQDHILRPVVLGVKLDGPPETANGIADITFTWTSDDIIAYPATQDGRHHGTGIGRKSLRFTARNWNVEQELIFGLTIERGSVAGALNQMFQWMVGPGGIGGLGSIGRLIRNPGEAIVALRNLFTAGRLAGASVASLGRTARFVAVVARDGNLRTFGPRIINVAGRQSATLRTALRGTGEAAGWFIPLNKSTAAQAANLISIGDDAGIIRPAGSRRAQLTVRSSDPSIPSGYALRIHYTGTDQRAEGLLWQQGDSPLTMIASIPKELPPSTGDGWWIVPIFDTPEDAQQINMFIRGEYEPQAVARVLPNEQLNFREGRPHAGSIIATNTYLWVEARAPGVTAVNFYYPPSDRTTPAAVYIISARGVFPQIQRGIRPAAYIYQVVRTPGTRRTTETFDAWETDPDDATMDRRLVTRVVVTPITNVLYHAPAGTMTTAPAAPWTRGPAPEVTPTPGVQARTTWTTHQTRTFTLYQHRAKAAPTEVTTDDEGEPDSDVTTRDPEGAVPEDNFVTTQSVQEPAVWRARVTNPPDSSVPMPGASAASTPTNPPWQGTGDTQTRVVYDITDTVTIFTQRNSRTNAIVRTWRRTERRVVPVTQRRANPDATEETTTRGEPTEQRFISSGTALVPVTPDAGWLDDPQDSTQELRVVLVQTSVVITHTLRRKSDNSFVREWRTTEVTQRFDTERRAKPAGTGGTATVGSFRVTPPQFTAAPGQTLTTRIGLVAAPTAAVTLAGTVTGPVITGWTITPPQWAAGETTARELVIGVPAAATAGTYRLNITASGGNYAGQSFAINVTVQLTTETEEGEETVEEQDEDGNVLQEGETGDPEATDQEGDAEDKTPDDTGADTETGETTRPRVSSNFLFRQDGVEVSALEGEANSRIAAEMRPVNPPVSVGRMAHRFTREAAWEQGVTRQPDLTRCYRALLPDGVELWLRESPQDDLLVLLPTARNDFNIVLSGQGFELARRPDYDQRGKFGYYIQAAQPDATTAAKEAAAALGADKIGEIDADAPAVLAVRQPPLWTDSEPAGASIPNTGDIFWTSSSGSDWQPFNVDIADNAQLETTLGFVGDSDFRLNAPSIPLRAYTAPTARPDATDPPVVADADPLTRPVKGDWCFDNEGDWVRFRITAFEDTQIVSDARYVFDAKTTARGSGISEPVLDGVYDSAPVVTGDVLVYQLDAYYEGQPVGNAVSYPGHFHISVHDIDPDGGWIDIQVQRRYRPDLLTGRRADLKFYISALSLYIKLSINRRFYLEETEGGPTIQLEALRPWLLRTRTNLQHVRDLARETLPRPRLLLTQYGWQPDLERVEAVAREEPGAVIRIGPPRKVSGDYALVNAAWKDDLLPQNRGEQIRAEVGGVLVGEHRRRRPFTFGVSAFGEDPFG